MAQLALVAAVITALVDWWSVRNNRGTVEQFAKPLVMVALIVAAATASNSPRLLIGAGLAFGLIGDIALLPRFDRFVAGLGAFLIGHLLYGIAFVVLGVDLAWLLIGAVVAVVAVSTIGKTIVSASPAKLRIPVAVYVAVIGFMVALGIGTGHQAFGFGAAIFAASDALLGNDRFVTPRGDRRVIVHMLYHLGQVLLVGGLFLQGTS